MGDSADPSPQAPMRIAIAGASGLIGSALSSALRASGHAVIRLVRTPRDETDAVVWNPATGKIDATRLGDVDAIVNLAGENIGAGRWTASRREAIWLSRIDATRTLVGLLRQRHPRPAVLVNASAVGFYGDCGDQTLSEDHAAGDGFLADVCEAWELEARAAESTGVRVVRARFGVVLAREGGALAKMLPLFRCGLGGRMGTGRQWMSWIALDDAVRALLYLVGNHRCSGVFNLTAPAPVTNAEFTRVLAQRLRRPAMLPVPAWALTMILGEMARGTLLASTRAVPERLLAEPFHFEHPHLEAALRHVLRS